MDPILTAIFFSVVVFFLTWMWSVRKNFYSIVDAVWASSFGFLGWIYFFYGDQTLPQMIYLAMILVWSLRLGSHLFIRLFSHFPKEDVRYVKLREDFHPQIAGKFLAFNAVQALSQIILSIPYALFLYRGATEIGWNVVLGFILFPIAVMGEGLADRQLKQFKANPESKGKVCDVGLWRYSRHPNYFFEFLIWVAFALPAFSVSGGAWAFLAPAMMLFLLLKVSGVPLSEELSIKSKGQAYLNYMEETSVFIPLPRRKK